MSESILALERAGVSSAVFDARLLVSDALGCASTELGLRMGEAVSQGALASVVERISARMRRVPVQHILGRWPFLDFEVRTDHRALIPRPETEDLALVAQDSLDEGASARVIDVGTGSGVLALALARSHPRTRILALDIDAEALSLTQDNLREHGVETRIQTLQSDLLTAVADRQNVDLIVANLPYVASEEYGALEPEVRCFEPQRALVAAEGGLQLILRLIDQAERCLRRGGRLLLEMSPTQIDRVVKRIGVAPWEAPRVIKDRFERNRGVLVRRGA